MLASVAEHRQSEPRKLGLAIRGELDWIVMKALDKDRARRYDSAGSMARDIQRYLDGEAIHAAPPSAAYKARKFIRRNRGPVLAASLLAVALVAGLTGTSFGFINANLQRKVAETQRDRAEVEKERADTKAAEARAAEARANTIAYGANLLAAGDAIAASFHTKARAFLENAPESLHGWEWNVLKSRLDESSRALHVPFASSTPDLRGIKFFPHPEGGSFFTVQPYDTVAAQQWDSTTGELLAEFGHPAGSDRTSDTSSSFSLSADGDVLSAYCSIPGTGTIMVSSWELSSGNRSEWTQTMPPGERPRCLGISPDGARLVFGDGQRTLVQDVETGETLATTDLSFDVAFAWFNQDGSLLGVADGRGNLELRDGQSLEHVVTLDGHRNLVGELKFSRDGRWVGSSSLDDTARIWDLHAAPPTSVVLEHPPGRGSRHHLARRLGRRNVVWRWGDPRVECSHRRTPGSVLQRQHYPRAADVHARWQEYRRARPRRHHAVLGCPRRSDGESPWAPGSGGRRGHRPESRTDCLSRVGRLERCLRLRPTLDAQTGDPVAVLGNPGEIARFLAVSPVGGRAALAISPRASPNVPEDAVRRNGVVILDLEIGRETLLDAFSTSMAFDPAGEQLAMGEHARLEVRDARDGSVLRSRETGFLGRTVGHVSWSPDGRFLSCSSVLNEPRATTGFEILDAESLETVRRFEHSPMFSPDGQSVIVGSPTGPLSVISTETWEVTGTIDAHAMARYNIVHSPDGTRYATRNGGEGEFMVWSTETNTPVAQFQNPGYAATIAWSADSKRLVGTCGRTIYLWDATPLRERVQARDASRAASEIVVPLVDRLFSELAEASRVLGRVNDDLSLSQIQKKVARQEILRRGFAQQ